MTRSLERGRSRHAIVIGGGIGGLLAARVLSDHFDHVTVLERDRLFSTEGARAGVPQARHAHIMLGRGHECMEALFPGIGVEMEAAGAPLFDVGLDCVALYPKGYLLRRRAGVNASLTSRTFREVLMRRRLAETGRVFFRDGVCVAGLVPEGSGVAGVRLKNLAGGGEATVFGDIVVAACGRAAPVVHWLGALGHAPPEEVVVDAGLSYSSRWYKLARHSRPYRAVVELPGAPDRPRGGVAFQTEHDAWVVTLIGTAKARPPTDEAGFLAWARSLEMPHLGEIIEDGEPISPIHGYAKTDNRRRRFEAMASFPERFVVLGDAAASLNPVYGQGMTVAALGAIELGKCLEEQRKRVGGPSLTGLSKRFQRRLARVQDPAWTMATAEDFRWPGTVGPRPGAALGLVNAYFDRILELATVDPVVHTAMLRVTHLLDPAPALFHPRIAGRVLALATRPARVGLRLILGEIARQIARPAGETNHSEARRYRRPVEAYAEDGA